ncbi:MAG: uridine diphosphate-N-acetylglucosamine-binding protein YvcK [Actinomycetota bacterium]|nr:uridine diphosphate-N-acetylglucosamine-binding protein YvcK [Actinomycetota bacterium]
MNGGRVVGLGGGHGLAATLRAARRYASEVDAVVTVADDGGSSGRLTRELGIPPPGDIRNCLVALADETELSKVYQHRFRGGALTGHTAGNILIAAMTEIYGDFAKGVEAAGELLGSRGRVYPATTELVVLNAQVDGRQITGQAAVAATRRPIQAVYLEPPDPVAFSGAVDAIMSADQIILGPGSLFTSLIATILVPGIRKALQDTPARRVFVCNSRMQKGETEGLDAPAHLGALMAHIGPFSVDAAVVQSPAIPTDGVEIDRSGLESSGVEIIEADISNADGSHDPDRMAPILASLSGRRATARS